MKSGRKMRSNCWICRGEANSAEHRIKKADLVRAYGKGAFFGSSAPLHIRGTTVSPVRGPGAKSLKYHTSLCAACNNSGTQPYDLAYDKFMEWVWSNETLVLQRRCIDFENVYGRNFEESQRNLFKYFVKSLGCRLVDAGEPVPGDLLALLPVNSFRTALKITFCVNEDILLMPRDSRSRFIGKGDLFAWRNEDGSDSLCGYTWDEHVSWLTVTYWYNRYPSGELGSAWIANSQFIYLGSMAPLSDSDRAEVTAKMRRDPMDELAGQE